MTASETTRTKRNISRSIGEIFLNLAALGGFVAVTLVVVAVFFHITLIMFQTGSMSPSIPTGSLAIVREVPASEIVVGDVVTVDRPGELPITHRVTSVSDLAADGSRVIRMKGDANELEDPHPYTVSTVRSMILSVPGLAYVVSWFSTPLVLGSITLAASILMVWAFWPRKSVPRHASQPEPGHETAPA
ncbi:MAG: hypothetical protein JWQ68_104 [Cryobacterium sp.]|jgi:signal peptidase|nr:hypothetical protein [Cryobacterium sp.]